MVQINSTQLYALLLFLVAICSVLGFFLGQRKQRDSEIKEDITTEVGIKKDLQMLNNNVTELKAKIQSLENKIEDDKQERRNDIRDVQRNLTEHAIMIEKLSQSYSALHKRVDYLYEVLNVNAFNIPREDENGGNH
jgi:uncharacterized protein YlxW (UPF0749 family)